MKNLRIYKGILSIIFSGTVLVSLSGCNKEETSTRQENLVGHMDVQKPDDIQSTDFICYNVGNHEHVGITDQKKLLQKCSKNEISTALIIDCDATTRYDIYEDIEFTKSLLEEYSIDMPVYLSIENIMSNDNLTMNEKASLINEYLSITSMNNIYTGLYGTSTNLSYLKQYGSSIVQKYDCFVVEDGKTNYDGKSSIRQDINGNIKSTYESTEFGNDLAKYIKSKKYNSPKEFKQNGYYIVDDTCNLDHLAIKQDISVNDILQFNRIEKKDIKPGMVLRIPNQIQNKTELVFPELKRQEEALYRGIDISCYQGTIDKINFKKLSENIDFAILKIGEQANKNFKELREDPCFNDYYNECIKYKIPVGGYYVTHATTINEAIEEAKLVVNRIKDLNITYPVYIDYENTTNSIYEKEFEELKQNGGFKQMLEQINEIFKKVGLRFGIYANLSTYSEMVKMVGLQTLNQYEIWLSKPNEYYNTQQVLDLGPTCKTANGKYSYGCDMNQVSWTISDLGIGNAEGYVDYNLCYKDYEQPKQIITLPPEQVFETQQFKRTDKVRVRKNIIKTACGLTILLFVAKKRKKIKKIIKRTIYGNQKVKRLDPQRVQ